MSFFEKHKKGIIGTVIFHTIVLLLLIFLGFFTSLPLPGEEGILVNFGNSEQGLGEHEPQRQQAEPEPPPPVQQQEEEQSPPPPQPTATPPETQPEQAEEEALTQDYEETAAIDAAEKIRQEEKERQRQIEEERRRQKALEEQRQAEIRQRQQEELERQRQAELQRQKREESERKKREEEQRKINEINSRARGAFGGNERGTEGQVAGDSQSQGATFPGGNQGDPAGDPDAGDYAPGGKGTGDQGTGVSYDLSGRSALSSLPKPDYPGNDEGVVVVKVQVDKNGNVTAADPGARGTTIVDQKFWNAAKQAALRARFNIDEDAPPFQQGTISYRFTLN